MATSAANNTPLTPDEVGKTLGNYRILDLIGVGGMARVFLAEHVQLGRRVALKKLNDDLACSSAAVQRFFQEARSVNLIKHAHLIQITDFIETSSGTVAYVMELLEGEGLDALLAREAPLTVERTLRIALQVADVLAVVHATGVVHRDLKPSNIFLTVDQQQPDFVKVLDFGISKIINAAAHSLENTALTQTGVILGTPRYMSPEQAYGKEADQRSDIYMLGVMLYEMLTGTNPFVGRTTIETLLNQTTVSPVAPSVHAAAPQNIPRDLDAVVLACLCKDPERRFPSMRALETALAEIQTKQPLSTVSRAAVKQAAKASQQQHPTRFRRWLSTSRGRALAISALVALLLGVGIVASRTTSESVVETKVSQPSAVPTNAGVAAPVPPDVNATVPGSTATLTPLTVSLTFESNPAGATVSDLRTQEILGTTPFTRDFPVGDGTVSLQFKRTGYVPVTKQLGRQASAILSVELAKAPEARPSKRVVKPRPGKRSEDPDATLSPF